MKNESVDNAHKPFFTLLPGKQSKHYTDWRTLPTYSTAVVTTTTPARQWHREGSKAFSTAFKSGIVSAFAILGIMDLQQHAGFLGVISTFWEKQHFFMGFARQRANSVLLISSSFFPFSGFFFFSPFFFFSGFFFPLLFALRSCMLNFTLERGTWRGQEGGMQYLNGTYVPQHPKYLTERPLPPKQPWYVNAGANS